jgi:hypothetical protein
MAHRRKPARPPAGRRPQKGQKNIVKGRPRKRRSMFSRSGNRTSVLVVVSLTVVGIAGIAVANAISSTGNTLPTASVDEQPTPKPTPSATASPAATHPTHQPTPRVTEASAKPERTAGARPSHSAKPSPSAPAKCPSSSVRLAQARDLFQHPDSQPQSSVVTAGPRSDTLATVDAGSRTVTLYLRDCADETTTRMAVAWMYVTGQLIPVETWDSAKQARWRQLRGASLGSTLQLRQDVAAVFAYWQVGTTQSWQSPVPPPSRAQLAQLAPFLT